MPSNINCTTVPRVSCIILLLLSYVYVYFLILKSFSKLLAQDADVINYIKICYMCAVAQNLGTRLWPHLQCHRVASQNVRTCKTMRIYVKHVKLDSHLIHCIRIVGLSKLKI